MDSGFRRNDGKKSHHPIGNAALRLGLSHIDNCGVRYDSGKHRVARREATQRDAAMTEFANRFDALPDIPIRVRASNARRHSRRYILAIAFGALRGGGQTGANRELCGHSKRELLQSFLKLENGIPGPDTCSRLLGMLDLDAFRRWFVGFGPQFAAGGGGARAVDGKTCAVLMAARRRARHCTWSVPGLRSSVRRWGRRRWTLNPARLRRGPGCRKC